MLEILWLELKHMEYNIGLYGTYVFYEDGKEIYRSKNLLTKFGKRYLTQYLAGTGGTQAKDIAIGIGTSTPTVNDTQLDFEFYKSRASVQSADIQTSSATGQTSYAVVYKTTLPVDVSGYINEVGLFPSIGFNDTDYQSKIISTFENNTFWLDGSSPAAQEFSPSPLIGTKWISLTSTGGAVKQYTYATDFDLLGYSSEDSITLSYRQSDTNLQYVFVRFYSSDSDYYEARFSGSTVGNKLAKLNLRYLYDNLSQNNTAGFNVGSPNQSIIKISVGAKANASTTSNVLFDGLRINDEDSFRTDYGMISRSVLSTPQIKTLGKEMDIEYRLGINF